MRIYGSPQNQQTFAKIAASRLDSAQIDRRQAFRQVKVYLGEEYANKDVLAAPGIIDTGIDFCRKSTGEAGVEARVAGYLGKELGKILADQYLKGNRTRWLTIEKMLGHKLDHNIYPIKGTHIVYRPAEEIFADIFDAILKEQKKSQFTLSGETVYSNEELSSDSKLIRRITLELDTHLWRKWIYRLWGQKS